MDKFLEKYNLLKLSEVKITQSCPTLCDPMHCRAARLLCPWNSPGRILVWVAISSSRGSSQPKHWTQVSCIASRSLSSEPPGKPKPGGHRISEQTNHNYRNWNCNQKSSNKEHPRTRWLHRWILPKVWRRVNTYPAQTLPEKLHRKENFQTHSMRPLSPWYPKQVW